MTCHQSIRFEPGQNRVDIAFMDSQAIALLKNPDKFIAVALSVPQQVQDRYIEQSLAELSLPIVEIQGPPHFRRKHVLTWFPL